MKQETPESKTCIVCHRKVDKVFTYNKECSIPSCPNRRDTTADYRPTGWLDGQCGTYKTKIGAAE